MPRRSNLSVNQARAQARADAAETDRLEPLFERANQLLGENADNLRGQALLAAENSKDREAMRVLSFVWGRSAHHMATAVKRYPAEFMPQDNLPPGAQTTDEVLALFEMSRLPAEQSDDLHRSFRELGLRAWQVRDRVDLFRKTDSECIRANFKRSRLLSMSSDGVVRIKLADPGELARMRQFLPNARLDMLLFQLPNRPGWGPGEES